MPTAHFHAKYKLVSHWSSINLELGNYEDIFQFSIEKAERLKHGLGIAIKDAKIKREEAYQIVKKAFDESNH